MKTLFNQGVVRAFGKKDMKGAEDSWNKVIEIAPDSDEGRSAKQGIDGLKSGGHGGAATTDQSTSGSSTPGNK